MSKYTIREHGIAETLPAVSKLGVGVLTLAVLELGVTRQDVIYHLPMQFCIFNLSGSVMHFFCGGAIE